jgi:hypothetical protein
MENESLSSEGSIKLITINVGENDINVMEYMPLSFQMSLLDNYFATLQDESILLHRRLFIAESGLQLGVIDLMTNIAVDEDFVLDDINNSGVYQKIIDNIKNYSQFIEILKITRDAFIDNINFKQSLGGKVDTFLDNINIFIRSVANMDMDKDTLKELVETLQNTQKDFNDKWAIQPVPQTTEREAKDVAKASTARKPRKKAAKSEEQS